MSRLLVNDKSLSEDLQMESTNLIYALNTHKSMKTYMEL